MAEVVKVSADTNAAVVNVESAWWSKINWVNAISIVSAILVYFKGAAFGIPPEIQQGLAVAIPVFANFLTWILKTFCTNTITPSSATSAIVQIPTGVEATVELKK